MRHCSVFLSSFLRFATTGPILSSDLRFIHFWDVGHSYAHRTRTRTHRSIYLIFFFTPCIHTFFLYIDDYIDGERSCLINVPCGHTYLFACRVGGLLPLIILPRLVVVIFVDETKPRKEALKVLLVTLLLEPDSVGLGVASVESISRMSVKITTTLPCYVLYIFFHWARRYLWCLQIKLEIFLCP